jgi:lysyl-tRNA synthetase, class II
MTDEVANQVADDVMKLHLDEATGEKVSKSELKKRQKLRSQEEKKQQRAATAPPKPKAEEKKSTDDDESNLTPNVRISQACPFPH